MATPLCRPHLDQLDRDLLEDLGLAISEIESDSALFDDQALNAVEVLAE